MLKHYAHMHIQTDTLVQVRVCVWKIVIKYLLSLNNEYFKKCFMFGRKIRKQKYNKKKFP